MQWNYDTKKNNMLQNPLFLSVTHFKMIKYFEDVLNIFEIFHV